ncbi:peroxisomal trans-2-enoyl-reductase-like [Micractinium conductrix]|uniref:Peroxisomal trans-2-enoyl-reductase-like n=1 Tax=Micractinium conductrix TaxID=554055 RepID=A0A2P6VN68_9CHLO|nr:peroxisomal trans-2-enoyl-reductase-like [Micractinium conductrix]|eukprot:PSC75546.1 peroxisomal trans-2-enoyl-reductase-like [Micractinium conductrix]
MAQVLDQFSAYAAPMAPSARREAPARNRLAGRLAVVGGASGIVGSGISRQLLMEGAKVVALLRREDQKAGLLRECQGAPVENLFPVVVEDVSKEEQVAAFVRDVVAAHGPIDHAVSCFGAWWSGGVLTEQSYDEFSQVIANFAGSHFVFSKYVLPQMSQSPTSSFLYITGGVGKRVLSADSGLATVGGAALYGVVRAAQAQYQGAAPRINEMRIYALVTRHGETPRYDSHFVQGLHAHSNRKVGNLAAEQLLTAVADELMEVTSERLDGVMLMVGD